MKDGSFPIRGQSPGPELKTTLPLEAKQFKEQSEQRGMHAILLAIGAAQNRLIVTFPGYAGDTGKPANAALPVELIKQACHRILKQQPGHPGFKIRRHGIHAHEAAIGEKKETSETHTYDRQAVAAAQALGQEQSGEDLVINPARPFASWSLDEWVEFWKNPAEGLFKSLDLKTVWLEDELPTDEALQPPRTEGKMTSEQRTTMYNAIRWAKNYQSRTADNLKVESANPDLVAAKLSGHFSEQATEEHLDAILAKTGKGAKNGWGKFIQDYFGIETPPTHLDQLLPSYKSTHFPVAYYINDWLILALSDDESVEEEHLLVGLAALSKLQSQGLALNNVAIFGLVEKTKNVQGPDGQTLKGTNGKPVRETYDAPGAHGIKTTSTKDSRELTHALESLATHVRGSDFFLGKNISAACAKHLMAAKTNSEEKSHKYESQIFGSPFKKGDIHDNHGRLLSPARFKPEKVTILFKDALQGCEFISNDKLSKSLKKDA